MNIPCQAYRRGVKDDMATMYRWRCRTMGRDMVIGGIDRCSHTIGEVGMRRLRTHPINESLLCRRKPTKEPSPECKRRGSCGLMRRINFLRGMHFRRIQYHQWAIGFRSPLRRNLVIDRIGR